MQFPHWTETKRAPAGNVSNNDQVARAVDRIRPSLQDRLFNLFSNYEEYGPFSNKLWGDWTGISQYDSLESLHDEIHIEVGHGGHLFFIQYSAFDPVFFLHHAMADRIVAMWQVLHPNSWVTEQNTTAPTFTMGEGFIQNSTTSLTPFLAAADGTFWNSESARYTQDFGYSYAETANMTGISGVELEGQVRVKSAINRLYGSMNPSILLRKRKRDSLADSPTKGPSWLGGSTEGPDVVRIHYTDLSSDVHLSVLDMSAIVVDNYYTEWLINVRVINGALDGSFSISFFLGSPPQNHASWKTAQNLIGTMGVFAMLSTGSQSQISGTVPLTSALMRMVAHGEIRGLTVDDIVPYLRQHLHVGVSDSNEQEISPRNIPGLCIGIASSEVSVAEHDWELPRWGPVEERFTMFC